MRGVVKARYYIVILLFASFFFTPHLMAAGTTGVSGADFLELGVGSRSIALGEAYTTGTKDINAIYYNPAAGASLKYPVLSIFHQELLLDSRFENVTGSYPLKDGTLIFGNSLFWVPAFDYIDVDGNKAGEVQFYNGAFTTGYAYDLRFMYVGATTKYVYQRVHDVMYHSIALDLGVMKSFYMYSPFETPIRNFHIGLSVLNLGTQVNDDPLPRTVHLGASYSLTKWLAFYSDFSENIIESSDLYDFTYGFDQSFRMKWGVELSYQEIVALRAGYKFNDGATYSFGFGFNYAVKNVAFMVDTSYADSGVFGPVYSFNISFKLIPKVITREDVIQAESHYRQGIKSYVADDIDSALEQFKLSRDYNPYHKNIDRKIRDIEELKELKRENQKLYEEYQEMERNSGDQDNF